MLYLASQSPRRRELLDQIQVAYQTLKVDTDESVHAGESPETYVQRVALQKAQAGFALQPQDCVLGADTAVIYQQQILGKPTDKIDAQRMLQTLSGKTHQVMTAVAIVSKSHQLCQLNTSQVTFRTLTQAEIQAYVATQEPMDKAGSYAVQGLASIFIERIEGSYSGVMGLPLYETAQLLQQIDASLLQWLND
ncbi:Maf family protein [Candidatus Albibeggiatoa sp. nov. NOAA]|uniref:Maf family protein n=1 Tax=Candidatus Albibeggiatoa sp. nov. NOAA TaxID=3162724 RepID=UPI0032F7A6C6|nr:Maf-like protein [Thiotrichaceae bacterium]